MPGVRLTAEQAEAANSRLNRNDEGGPDGNGSYLRPLMIAAAIIQYMPRCPGRSAVSCIV